MNSKNIVSKSFPQSVAQGKASTPLYQGAELFARISDFGTLERAWERVRRNQGAAGGDGVSQEAFARVHHVYLARLAADLRSGEYKPRALRKASIPKSNGGVRQLTIPSIIDRVAQSAVVLVLGPLLDQGFDDNSFGYRPNRGVAQAIARVSAYRAAGFTHVVDADIDSFFDEIPIDPLLVQLSGLFGDGPLLALIGLWLEQAADEQGRGLAQGSPLSPLLANLALDALDETLQGRGVRLVRYADDFVLLCKSPGGAQRALERCREVLADLGLAISAEKTAVTSFDMGFRFLGHRFVRSLVMVSPNSDQGFWEDLQTLPDAKSTVASQPEAYAPDPKTRVVYILEPERRVSVLNSALRVEEYLGRDGDGKALWHLCAAIHVKQISRIEVGPKVEVDPAALRFFAGLGLPFVFVNGWGEMQSILWEPQALSGGLQLAQARAVLDETRRLALARCIVLGRIVNQRAHLRRLGRKRKEPELLELLGRLNQALRALPSGSQSKSLEVLRGHEGAAAALYWKGLAQLSRPELDFKGRRRRPAPDPMNAALNSLSALLERDALIGLQQAGLHPGWGLLHGARDQHLGLVYDLMEEFRVPLMESVAWGLFGKRALAKGDFILRERTQGQHDLVPSSEAYRAIIEHYEQAVQRRVKSQLYPKEKASWRTIISQQARALGLSMLNGTLYKPYRMDY